VSKLATLTGRRMTATFDTQTGTIHAIEAADDALGTNFLGNSTNVAGAPATDTRWTGDLVSTVYHLDQPDAVPTDLSRTIDPVPGHWERELTGCSGDIRTVVSDAGSFSVSYRGSSANRNGIRSYALTMRYQLDTDDALVWDIEIENTTDHLLEIGELGISLAANNHFARFWKDVPSHTSTLGDELQRQVHENTVIVHNFVGGHSSYTLMVRPLGNAPFLLMQPVGDTAFECLYKPEGPFGAVPEWAGPDILAIHAWATQRRRGWLRPWINGSSTLMLEPGEKRSYRIRFSFIDSYAAIRDQVYQSGNLGIRILPSMVLPEDAKAYVEVQSQNDIDCIEPCSDGIMIEGNERHGSSMLLTLRFRGRGQKTIKLTYGDGRWTNLHFYCVEPIEQLLKARGKFIVDRQFYDNPDDPYNRHHMFLPFDYQTGSTYRDADRAWEVGGSDEYGFSEALYLAEKNVYYPEQREIEVLETYVDDCLFRHIQDPESYHVRASLYWKERSISSPWSHWGEERSRSLVRTYNYPHPANIYHALYQIGRRYDLVTHRTPQAYLLMAYRTALRALEVGTWHHVGLMGNSNSIHIVNDLQAEGFTEAYEVLRAQMAACTHNFILLKYPYGSELHVDETAQEQVYFYTRYFGYEEKNRQSLAVLKALRGGDQPAWFWFGNDKRRYRYMGCWYSEALNGWALLQGFEDTGDREMLTRGFAGVMSVQANMLPDGMGFGFFNYSPGVFASVPACTLDNGIGQYGYFKAAKSYVVRDPAFGWVGYGCDVEADDTSMVIRPWDGLRKRVRIVSDEQETPDVDLEATTGEIKVLTFDQNTRAVTLTLVDSTGILKEALIRIIDGPVGDLVCEPEGRVTRQPGSDARFIVVPLNKSVTIRQEPQA
jgi:hypothetical protein